MITVIMMKMSTVENGKTLEILHPEEIITALTPFWRSEFDD